MFNLNKIYGPGKGGFYNQKEKEGLKDWGLIP